GLTMAPVLRRLGITSEDRARVAHELEQGSVRAARRALAALERMSREGLVAPEIAAELRGEYGVRIERAESRLRELHRAVAGVRDEAARTARHALLLAERESLLDSARQGYLGDDAASELLGRVDRAIVDL